MRFSVRCLCIWSLAACAMAPLPANAQSERKPERKPDSSLTAFSVGVLGVNGQSEPALTTVGLQFTQLRPSRISADLAIGTLPAAAFMGFVVVALRGGAALPLRMNANSFLIPSTGLSAIVAAAPGGGGGAVGANAGV